MDINIRPAEAKDKEHWHRLWEKYLIFYETVLTEEQTAWTWSRILDPDQATNCLVAETEVGLIAFATYFTHPSTWLKVGDCYLEDLFVAEAIRGGGVGRKMIEAVQAQADALGCERLYWHTNEDNARARALYDSITGGEDGYVRYRVHLKK